MKVKICGITRLEDAELAADLGAWAIGFLQWPESKRYVEPGVAAGIARVMRRKVDLVGVFVNQPLDDIARAVDSIGFTHVQLHGDEGPSFCQAVHQRTGAKVIKAARIAHAADLKDMDRFHTDLHLLDTPAAPGEFGGTGKTWDWGLLKQRRNRIPFLLAGGLNPDNVAEAIATASPWGVDVSSGVEASPGVKDPEKLRALFAVVDELAPATAPPEPRKPETLVYPPREDDEVDAARLAKPDGGARRPREAGDARPGGEVAGRRSPRGLVHPPRGRAGR